MHSHVHQATRPQSSFYQVPEPSQTQAVQFSPVEPDPIGIDPNYFALPRRLVIGNMYDKRSRQISSYTPITTANFALNKPIMKPSSPGSSNGTSVSSPASSPVSVPRRASIPPEPQRTYNWASHKSWNGRVRGFQCVLCDEHFRTLPLLNAHLSSGTHATPQWDNNNAFNAGGNGTGVPLTGIQIYHCPSKSCAKEFVTLNALCRHVENGSCRHSIPMKGDFRGRKGRKETFSTSGTETSLSDRGSGEFVLTDLPHPVEAAAH